MLQQFFLTRLPPDSILITGSYEPWLVLLSVFIAIFTASVALETASQFTASRSIYHKRLLWLVGTFAMGGGIWSMHFIGMLAFRICGTTGYDVWLTFFSMVPSLVASAVTIRLLACEVMDMRRALMGGVNIGLGIGAMHYSGMAAMNVRSALFYDPWLFALSIVVAVVFSVIGVWIRFGLKRYLPGLSRAKSVLAGGAVIGLATSLMHYTGMAAARFVGPSGAVCQDDLLPSTFLALSIAVVTIFIAFGSLALNVWIRQKNLRRHLLTERGRLLAIMNSSLEGIVLTDHVGRILEFNPASVKMFGYSREEVLGRNVNLLMPEPYFSEHDQYIRNYQETGIRKIIGTGREVVGRTKDQRTFPLDLSISEAVDEEGRMYIGILRDISERKKIEQSLHNAMVEAQQAAKAKTIFLANMSHEIRTPMNAIIGFVELLLAHELTSEQRRHLQTVQGSARSLLRLLNDILDTAKIDQGDYQLELIPFNVQQLMDEMSSLYRLSAINKGLSWEIKIAEDMPHCFLGDVTRIRQILTNLVGNAIKFTQKGEVSVEVGCHALNLVFRIIDSGIGIPADKLDEIFLPFAQSDASMTRRFGGTGLGTTISLQLAELMNGSIEVESELGKGSIFTVKIPLTTVSCDQVKAKPGHSQRVTLGRKLSVLVVEDVPENAELVRIHLQQDGHEIEHVDTGLLAVERLRQQSFDVVLMDIHMPIMDGLSATRKIRQWEHKNLLPAVPIIALSASVFEEDKKAAKQAGMDGFAAKPLDMTELYHEISKVTGVGLRQEGSTERNSNTRGFPEFTLLDFQKGLRRWRNAESYLKNIHLFGSNYTDYCEQVKAALAQSDYQQLFELAHKLKGSAATLEMGELKQLAQELEKSSKQESVTPDMIDSLEHLMHSLLQEIEQSRSTVTVKPELENRQLDCARLKQLTEEISESMHKGRFDEAYHAQLQQLLQGFSQHELYQAFDREVSSYEFDKASQYLRALVDALCEQQDVVQ